MTETELEALSAETFRTEGTDAHTLKGPTRAAEHRTYNTSFIGWIKDYFVAKVTGSRLMTSEEADKLASLTNYTPPPESPTQQSFTWPDGPPEVHLLGTNEIIVTSKVAEISGTSVSVAELDTSFAADVPTDGNHRWGAAVTDFADPAAPYNKVVFGVISPTSQPPLSKPLADTEKFISYFILRSDGALQPAPSAELQTTVTQTGENGVKSSGIWNFVYGTFSSLTTTAKTLVGAINELVTNKADIAPATRTGGSIRFDMEATYGTAAAPVADNLTLDGTNLKVGIVQLVIHNAPTAPTLATLAIGDTSPGNPFRRLSGSGDYVVGINNYIYLESISAGRIIYSISQ